MLWEWMGSPSSIPSREEEVEGEKGEEGEEGGEVDEEEKGEEEKEEKREGGREEGRTIKFESYLSYFSDIFIKLHVTTYLYCPRPHFAPA